MKEKIHTFVLTTFILCGMMGFTSVSSAAVNHDAPSSHRSNATDGTVKTIDKRTGTDASGNVYYLVFISKPTILQGGEHAGHAYVVWGVEDNTRQMSYAEAWGLHPDSQLQALTLGMVPGEMRDDGLNTSGYNRLIVQVDKSVYDSAHQKMQDWANQRTYQLLTHDCLSFTIDIATIANLNVPDRTGFDNIPWNYLVSLINAN